MSAISALNRARKSAGITSQELSRRSGILPSNLSAIESQKREPRIGTFERALAATGKRIIIANSGRLTAAEVAETIQIELQAGRTRDLFRYLIDLSDGLSAAETVEEFYAFLIEAPQSTGSQQWDATLDALVAYQASKHRLRAPSWVSRSLLPNPVAEKDAFWPGDVLGDPSLREFITTSNEFLARGVLVDVNDLASV